ncbi:MAG: hypothetical protein JWN46_2587 [Acidimicrobiales bacterium]|nr:hypothetical protein [Acidimicrobiales bacterium]
MAAIFQPHPELVPVVEPPRRPDLRMVHGGRSPAARRATYRRRRVVVGVLALFVAVAAVAVGRGGLASLAPAAPSAPAAPIGASAVVVRPGDTLWSIARRLHPNGDVRGVVDQLAAAHGQGPLRVGERLPIAS